MSILVTCQECRADNRVEAEHLVVRFCEPPDERAAELLFACAACDRVPVQRVPRELAAIAVLRGAASLELADVLPTHAHDVDDA